MAGPPLGPVGEDITWPDQVAPRGRKASSTRKIKPQTSNHILDVAPWWYLSDVTEALAPLVHCQYIADRVRGSMGEMRTATWRLTGQGVSHLVGKVYLSDSGMTPMFVISEADYAHAKSASQTAPETAMTPLEGKARSRWVK